MPAQPVCPYCRAKLFPHEVTNDECASCHGRLSAAVEWVPPAREAEEPASHADVPFVLPPVFPSILSNQPPPEAFAAVRQGIMLLRLGVGLGLGFGALALLGQFGALTTPNRGGGRLFLALGLMGDVFQVVSALTILLGVCFCCALPKECEPAKGARSVIACLTAAVISGAPVAAFIMVRTTDGGFPLQNWLPLIAVAFTLFVVAAAATLICFFLLLSDLSRYFDDGNLARRFKLICVLLLGYAAGALLSSCIVFMVATSHDTFSKDEIAVYSGSDCGISLMIGAALGAWFIALLARLRRLIPTPPGY